MWLWLIQLIQEEKLNRCNGFVVKHPSQREHSCLMMDNEEAWMLYRDDVLEKIDRLNAVLKTSESVCSAVGLKLAKSWQEKTNELPKMPWTSIFLTSLKLYVLVTIFRAVSCTFYITDPVVLNGKT